MQDVVLAIVGVHLEDAVEVVGVDHVVFMEGKVGGDGEAHYDQGTVLQFVRVAG